MRQVRVPLTEIRTGEFIVSIGRREINSRFLGMEDMKDGHKTVGPRGGRYMATPAGAELQVIVVTAGGRPVVLRTAIATVLRDVEED